MFVFTDIEGSTRLLASLGSRYEQVLAEHRRLLREALSSHGGVEVDTQGDALFFAFQRVGDAVAGAGGGQRELTTHDFGEASSCGSAWECTPVSRPRPQRATWEQMSTWARAFCAVAWGGQIVVSSATAALEGGEAEEISMRSLGEHALKDIEKRAKLH